MVSRYSPLLFEGAQRVPDSIYKATMDLFSFANSPPSPSLNSSPVSPLLCTFVTRGNGHLSGDSSKIHQCIEVDRSTIFHVLPYTKSGQEGNTKIVFFLAPNSPFLTNFPQTALFQRPMHEGPIKKGSFLLRYQADFPPCLARGEGLCCSETTFAPMYAHTR